MGALTRRAISELEPALTSLVDRLLDAIDAKQGGDLVADFASAIPVEVIGNLLAVPHEDRGQRHRLLADLQASGASAAQQEALLALAVEEFLRFEPSNQLGNRRTLVDCELAGQKLPAGTLVTLCIGAANRDPAAFATPQTLDLRREPNRHLAFGLGVHQCAGMSLARLEGRVAIGRFLRRFPRYRLSDTPQRGRRARFRGFLSAPFVV